MRSHGILSEMQQGMANTIAPFVSSARYVLVLAPSITIVVCRRVCCCLIFCLRTPACLVVGTEPFYWKIHSAHRVFYHRIFFITCLYLTRRLFSVSASRLPSLALTRLSLALISGSTVQGGVRSSSRTAPSPNPIAFPGSFH